MAKNKRVRDYKAEYARRKQLERERAAKEGRAFSMARARGHGKARIRKRIENLNATKAPFEREVTVADVEIMAQDVGWDVVEEALDRQVRMNQAWLDNNDELAHELWESRNEDLPDWLYHYHGFFN